MIQRSLLLRNGSIGDCAHAPIRVREGHLLGLYWERASIAPGTQRGVPCGGPQAPQRGVGVGERGIVAVRRISLRKLWGPGRFGVLLALGVAAVLAAAPSASAATFEVTGHFGGVVEPPAPNPFPEEAQLGGVNGLAVNVKGSGGVDPGTVYAVSRGLLAAESGMVRVSRYEPSGSGLELIEAWQVRPVEGPYERCGKLVGTACSPRPSALARSVDVSVDQATGNVYVFSTENLAAGDTAITAFNPDGSEVLARFGEMAPSGVSTAATAGQVHGAPPPGGIAVGSSGAVYIYDLNTFDNFYHRLMTFKPKTPGDLQTYEYVNAGDIGAGFLGETTFPTMPATDDAGNIYVTDEVHIEEYNPAQPQSPICKAEFKMGGISALAVNPATGEPFFYSYKDKKIHHLGACSEGTFAELPPPISVAPERSELTALAFDPIRQLKPREAGVLYGAAPEAVPKVNGTGQPGMGALGYIFASVLEVPPAIESEAVVEVGPTSAEVEAQINPKGSLTSFRFQYIIDADYQADGGMFDEGTLESPEGVLGAGQKPLRTGTMLAGLVPDTDYHYRVIATSHCSTADPGLLCPSTGSVKSLHTYPVEASFLADLRAYELVSPASKSGGQVLPADPITNTCGNIECKPGAAYSHFPMQAAPDGRAVVYEGTPFKPEGGAVIENEYIARRVGGSWATMSLTPSLLQSKGGQGYKAFAADLREGILEQTSPSFDSAPVGYTNLYRQPTSEPLSVEPLVTEVPPNRDSGQGANSFRTRHAGASADFSHQIFEANDALTGPTPFAPAAIDGGEEEYNLYESVNGQLRLVNVLPGNAQTAPGAMFGSGTLLQSGGTGPNARAVVTSAISGDGTRIFWTSAAGQLYVRIDGQESREIKDSGKFLTASVDGSRVLLSDGCLYDLAIEACEDLTAGKGGFQGIAGQSKDLSHVYFVLDPTKGTEALTKGTGDLSDGSATLTDVHATSGSFAVGQTIEAPGIPGGTTIIAVGAGTLELSAAALATKDDATLTAGLPLAAGEENSEGAKPKLNGFNLYASAPGTTRFIATLLPSDNGDIGDWQASPVVRNAEASPAGRWLAFLSTVQLTGVDNVGPCLLVGETGAYVDAPCSEVFLYDSATGELLCPSCNRSGAAPLGASFLRHIQRVPGSFPQPRYLTDTGRLYFDSRDSLTYLDTNSGIEDVYQYEVDGAGTCERKPGCVSMLSAGRGPVDSNFLATDASGDNVFFTTRDPLVPADKDDLIDLYDTRVGGGRGGDTVRIPCEGEGCQPVLTGPAESTSASEGALGTQNYKPTNCGKGKVRRGSKCFRKPHHKGKKKEGSKVGQRGGRK